MWRATEPRFWRVVGHYVHCAPCRLAVGRCGRGGGLEYELHTVWLRHRRDARNNPMRAGFLGPFIPRRRKP